jgi:hypothetical protein
MVPSPLRPHTRPLALPKHHSQLLLRPLLYLLIIYPALTLQRLVLLLLLLLLLLILCCRYLPLLPLFGGRDSAIALLCCIHTTAIRAIKLATQLLLLLAMLAELLNCICTAAGHSAVRRAFEVRRQLPGCWFAHAAGVAAVTVWPSSPYFNAIRYAAMVLLLLLLLLLLALQHITTLSTPKSLEVSLLLVLLLLHATLHHFLPIPAARTAHHLLASAACMVQLPLGRR